MDKITYQEGNLVLATNHPVTPSEDQKGKSQELRLTTRGIYYVTRVSPAHLRVVGLFTGETRNLPREFVTKITLSNLTQLQTYLQSYQLSKISDSLFRANKFLSPNQEKTWQFLLNKNQNKEIGEVYYDENSEPDLQNNQDHESPSLGFPPADAGPDLMSPADTGPTMTSGLHDPQPSSQPDFAHRQLRSGKVYCTLAVAPRKPILKISPVTSSPQNPPLVAQPPAQHQKCDPNCCEKNSNKELKFSEKLSVRFHTGNNFQDYTQDMIFHPLLKQKSKTFLMLSAIGIDSSNKELLYKVNWSSPSEVNSGIDTLY